jgi:polyisoprenoid-binding protein YceI
MTIDTAAPTLIAGTWAIDPSHSTVAFTARHLMSKVRGTFTEFSGEFVTTGNPLESTISVTIKAASINTNSEQRDNHLRSADFFDPDKGGVLTFVSTDVAPAGDSYVVTGDLTINGVTRSVALDTEFFGVETDGYGRTVLGAEASTTIDRHDYNVSWNMPLEGDRLLVGPKVKIDLSVEAVLA